MHPYQDITKHFTDIQNENLGLHCKIKELQEAVKLLQKGVFHFVETGQN